jgi:hypothetical protein
VCSIASPGSCSTAFDRSSCSVNHGCTLLSSSAESCRRMRFFTSLGIAHARPPSPLRWGRDHGMGRTAPTMPVSIASPDCMTASNEIMPLSGK